MARRGGKHPDAVRREQAERAALRPVPTLPPEEWMVYFKKRDGEKFARRGGKSLTEARERVDSYFQSDDRDELDSAWIVRKR